MTPTPRWNSVGCLIPDLCMLPPISGWQNGYFKEMRSPSTVLLKFIALSKDDSPFWHLFTHLKWYRLLLVKASDASGIELSFSCNDFTLIGNSSDITNTAECILV
ncbi:hypothetical protein Nepgr_016978 [Nepenthes gracilis]|uniref:Uncharacterized protein n=1 Tax=Nepenthes gracilis TaxID=150966 RepID=A0AAD3SRJ2_NEPGR|nr:hypothetical protein Nepgr_016978 [Nepenthes gracilis]